MIRDLLEELSGLLSEGYERLNTSIPELLEDLNGLCEIGPITVRPKIRVRRKLKIQVKPKTRRTRRRITPAQLLRAKMAARGFHTKTRLTEEEQSDREKVAAKIEELATKIRLRDYFMAGDMFGELKDLDGALSTLRNDRPLVVSDRHSLEVSLRWIKNVIERNKGRAKAGLLRSHRALEKKVEALEFRPHAAPPRRPLEKGYYVEILAGPHKGKLGRIAWLKDDRARTFDPDMKVGLSVYGVERLVYVNAGETEENQRARDHKYNSDERSRRQSQHRRDTGDWDDTDNPYSRRRRSY